MIFDHFDLCICLVELIHIHGTVVGILTMDVSLQEGSLVNVDVSFGEESGLTSRGESQRNLLYCWRKREKKGKKTKQMSGSEQQHNNSCYSYRCLII